MKVAYLTAGAGGMYCGSCLRDNTLAAALIRKGRDVVLIPLYTPTRTDEENVSQKRVYFGALNGYLQHKSAIFRHLPWPVGRLLDAPGLLQWISRRAGSTTPDTLGPLTVSTLRGPRGSQRKALAELIGGLRRIQPNLVHLPNAFFVGFAGEIKRRLAVPVLCSLTGEDSFLDKLPEPHQSEVLRLIRSGARDVDGFLAPTQYYRSYAIERFALPPEHVHLVPLGVRIDDPPDATRLAGTTPLNPQSAISNPQSPGLFTIGYLARICPDKGLHILCKAFEILRQAGRACRLVVAGTLGKADRPYFDAIRSEAPGHDRTEAFEYMGELDRPGKLRFLRSLDVLSVPTVYQEAKGIYVLEALSQGVPVVQPQHGSFPELIESTGGGLLFKPQSAQALADALARLMDDPPLRQRLGRRGRAAVRKSFTNDVMAEAAWTVFEAYCTQRNPFAHHQTHDGVADRGT